MMYPEIFSTLGGEQFLSAYLEKNVTHFEHESRDRFEDLLSWEMINHLMSLNLFDDKRIRVVKDSRDVPLSFYRRDSDRRALDSVKLTALLDQGSSLAINSVQFLSPGVRRIANQLERWLDQKVNVNAYISFGTGGAFTSHFDSHDVLVLQVYGSKDWTIYQQPEPYPIDGHAVKVRHAAQGRPILMERTLHSGEILFVPRGYFHQAAVKNSTSVHLTFGIIPAPGVEFIDRVRKRCLQVEEFRKDILGVAGPGALAEQELRMKTLLHQMIDEYSFETFLEERRRKRETVDFFRLGPEKEAQDDPVLVPLVRQRDGFALPTTANPDIARQVLVRLFDNNAMNLSSLCQSLDGEIEAEDIKTAVDCLVAGRLIEFAD
ncbi:MAG: cupin domain-containing protein [Novosphingobium sp.]